MHFPGHRTLSYCPMKLQPCSSEDPQPKMDCPATPPAYVKLTHWLGTWPGWEGYNSFQVYYQPQCISLTSLQFSTVTGYCEFANITSGKIKIRKVGFILFSLFFIVYMINFVGKMKDHLVKCSMFTDRRPTNWHLVAFLGNLPRQRDYWEQSFFSRIWSLPLSTCTELEFHSFFFNLILISFWLPSYQNS